MGLRVREAGERFLDLEGVEVLALVGLDGGFYKAAREWLHADDGRVLVFLEKDVGRWQQWLKGDQAEAMLKDPQVHFYWLSDANLDEIYARYAGKKMEVVADDHYREIKERLLIESHTGGRIIHEMRGHCRDLYRNFLSNLDQIGKSILGNGLFGKFAQVPAIVCGAGPSIDLQLSQLRSLRDKALIFAGGSALTAVGDIAHFGAGLDPFDPQVDRVLGAKAFEIPFFYTGRWHKEALSVLQGTPLYLPSSWAEAGLGEVLDTGHNVTNWSVEIARALGCSPIILVGVDLSYDGDAAYAEGVGAHEEWKGPIKDGLKTEWKWLAEAKWLGAYDKEKLINATARGLEIEGLEHRPLRDIKFAKSWPLKEWVHAEVAMASKGLSRVVGLKQELMESLDRCGMILDELDGGVRPGRAALLEVELEEEVAYETFLKPFKQISQAGVPLREVVRCLS